LHLLTLSYRRFEEDFYEEFAARVRDSPRRLRVVNVARELFDFQEGATCHEYSMHEDPPASAALHDPTGAIGPK
jgi:hypothetical protein